MLCSGTIWTMGPLVWPMCGPAGPVPDVDLTVIPPPAAPLRSPIRQQRLDLRARHIRAVIPQACPCHGCTYVFRGMGRPRGAPKASVTLRHVAEAAGVSPATVSNVIAYPDRVTAAARSKVEEAAARLGWVPGAAPADPAWHWRRLGFEKLLTRRDVGDLPGAQTAARPFRSAGRRLAGPDTSSSASSASTRWASSVLMVAA